MNDDQVEYVAKELRAANYVHLERKMFTEWPQLNEYTQDKWRVIARSAIEIVEKSKTDL